MVCSRAADAEQSEERAPARSTDHKCNILRVADRDPVARFARTLWPVHECVQSVQPLVSARGVEAYFRCSRGKGDAPDFVEVGEAGMAVDYAMRRQCRVELVG